jgi:hypothetical protein
MRGAAPWVTLTNFMSRFWRWVLAMMGVAGLGLVAVVLFGASLRDRLLDHNVQRESHTLIEAVKKVARLTTVEMNVSSFELRKDQKNLFGLLPIKCEKTVAIFYRGKVAAGFDLDDKTSLTVSTAGASASGGGRRLLVELPAPRLLYTDAPAPEVIVADGSLCNQLEASDYQSLHAEARVAVERQALAGGILKRAEDQARELIRAVALPLGFEVEVRTRTAILSSAR